MPCLRYQKLTFLQGLKVNQLAQPHYGAVRLCVLVFLIIVNEKILKVINTMTFVLKENLNGIKNYITNLYYC